MSTNQPEPNDQIIENETTHNITQNIVATDGSKVQHVQQVLTSRESLAGRLEIQFPKRTSTYYSVTDAEISIYAQFGWLATICLTLFGTTAGLALGCLVALLQANIPDTAQATLATLGWAGAIVSVIFFLIAVALIFLQSRRKKEWEPSK